MIVEITDYIHHICVYILTCRISNQFHLSTPIFWVPSDLRIIEITSFTYGSPLKFLGHLFRPYLESSFLAFLS